MVDYGGALIPHKLITDGKSVLILVIVDYSGSYSIILYREEVFVVLILVIVDYSGSSLPEYYFFFGGRVLILVIVDYS